MITKFEDKSFDSIAVLQLWGLDLYFKYFMKYNQSSNTPYHNTNHTLQLIYRVNEAFNYEGRYDCMEIKSLLLGALFHDFNHSGGLLNDNKNIRMAIIGLEDAHKWVKETNNYKAVHTSILKRAINFIKATEYPYVIKDEKLNRGQQIIRDCDILCYFSRDWITQVMMGLTTECNALSNKARKDDDYAETLNKMETFLEEAYILCRTDYAKRVFENNLKPWKEKKEYLVKVFQKFNK